MGEVKTVLKGARNPFEWLLSGLPAVDKDTSLSRAARCVTCPMNGVGELTDWFTVPAAAGIRQLIGLKEGRKLRTLYDAALGVCEACRCPMTLKVHEPTDLLLKQLTPEVKEKLWERCWIRDLTGELPTPKE